MYLSGSGICSGFSSSKEHGTIFRLLCSIPTDCANDVRNWLALLSANAADTTTIIRWHRSEIIRCSASSSQVPPIMSRSFTKICFEKTTTQFYWFRLAAIAPRFIADLQSEFLHSPDDIRRELNILAREQDECIVLLRRESLVYPAGIVSGEDVVVGVIPREIRSKVDWIRRYGRLWRRPFQIFAHILNCNEIIG